MESKIHSLLIDVIIFASAAVIFVPLFRKFKLGAILAYLFAGIIIGPHALAFIKDTEVILHFSELGVVLLLFLIGLELAPERVWRLRHTIFGLGLLQVVLTGALFTGMALFFDLPLSAAYAIGFGLALSSTAFSIQILQENNQLNTSHGQGAFSILMFQDLAIVPILASLAFFSHQHSSEASSFSIYKALLFLFIFAFLGQSFIRQVLKLVADTRNQEVFTAMSLLIVLGTALFAESVGLSMGMGAFLAGVLLANSEYRHELEVNLMPFKGLLLGLFFIAIGMSLNLSILNSHLHWIILITIGFMTLKSFIIYGLGRAFKFPKEVSRNMALILPQGGEFGFVLFNNAVGRQLMDPDLNSMISASVTLSMILTPFVFSFNARYLRRFSEISEKPYDQIIDSDEVEVIIAGYGRFGQIVSRLLRSENVKHTILEHDASQVETARKFGSKVYYGDASRKDTVILAGGSKAKTFVLAIDDVNKSVRTARMITKHFPHLEIIARVRNRSHAMDLMAIGIKNIHRETYLTSLEVAREVLLKKGRKLEMINRKIQKFQAHDEEVLKKQLDLRNDEKQFLSFTHETNQNLEEILSADQEK